MIALVFLCSIVSGCLCFAMGAWLNYNRGYGDGWDDAEAFTNLHDDVANIRWELTAGGKKALAEARSTLPDLPSPMPDLPSTILP